MKKCGSTPGDPREGKAREREREESRERFTVSAHIKRGSPWGELSSSTFFSLAASLSLFSFSLNDPFFHTRIMMKLSCAKG